MFLRNNPTEELKQHRRKEKSNFKLKGKVFEDHPWGTVSKMLLSLVVISHKRSPDSLEKFLKKFGEKGLHPNPQIVKY